MRSTFLVPYRRTRSLRHSLDRLANDRYLDAASIVRSKLYVPMNVEATDDGYTITALVPGIDAKHLEIQVLDDTVTIQGELFAGSDEDDQGAYLLREIPSGGFSRAIRLSSPLDPEKAEAAINDGVLTLQLPKADSARPKNIKVQVK